MLFGRDCILEGAYCVVGGGMKAGRVWSGEFNHQTSGHLTMIWLVLGCFEDGLPRTRCGDVRRCGVAVGGRGEAAGVGIRGLGLLLLANKARLAQLISSYTWWLAYVKASGVGEMVPEIRRMNSCSSGRCRQGIMCVATVCPHWASIKSSRVDKSRTRMMF